MGQQGPRAEAEGWAEDWADGQYPKYEQNGRCSLLRRVSCCCRCLLSVTHGGGIVAVSFEIGAEFLILFGDRVLSLSVRTSTTKE